MATKDKKIASSPTIKGLEKLINEYLYSTTYQIFPDLTITNSKGVYLSMYVKKVGSRYVLFEK